MSKGENIFKRKDGRWEARYIKGYELSGKIKYGFCYGRTYKEAKEKVAKFKAAMVSGSPLPAIGSRHRFAFYCDEWLRLRKPKIKEATYIKYDTALEKHIKPRLGGCFPLGITSGLIDDFTKELLFEAELAPKTVHDILVVLHGVLKYTATLFPGIFPAIEINYPNEADVSYNNLMYCGQQSCGCKKKEHDRALAGYLTHVDGTSIDALKSRKIPRNNTTGVKGVYFIKGRYLAKIVFQHRQYSLGTYNTLADAAEARKKGEELLNEKVVGFYETWSEKAAADPAWAEQNPIKISVRKADNGELCVELQPEV